MGTNDVGRRVLRNRYRLAAGRRAADGRSAGGAGAWHRFLQLAFRLHRIELTSSDSSVVALAPSNGPPPSITLVALRPGRSTIAVNGLRGLSDELSWSPRARTLTRTCIVTRRLTQVEIAPRPKEIVAGSRLQLVARAIDESGAVVASAPVSFYVIYDPPGKYGRGPGRRQRRSHDSRPPPVHCLLRELRGHARCPGCSAQSSARAARGAFQGLNSNRLPITRASCVPRGLPIAGRHAADRTLA